MGHLRLGKLPDTRPWRRVVEHLADGSTTAVVAGAAAKAAANALSRATTDKGVARVLFLLARLTHGARQADPVKAWEEIDLLLSANPTLSEVTAAFSDAQERWHHQNGVRNSDLSEMACLSGVEAITRIIGERSSSLFPTPDVVCDALRDAATPRGFAALAHETFAGFTRRFLNYHLDRELSQHVGGNGRFPDHQARRDFARDLEVHCREAARIVRDYAHDWYSKSRFVSGLSEVDARRFSKVCLGKITKELQIRGGVA